MKPKFRTAAEEISYLALKAIQEWSWTLPMLLRENEVWHKIDTAIETLEAEQRMNADGL